MPAPGPAWHRASIHPDEPEPESGKAGAGTSGAEAGADAAAVNVGAEVPPPSPPPVPPAPPSADPALPSPPGSGGGQLVAGAFLTVAGLSVTAGFISLLIAANVGYPANATACGIAFAVFFFLAVALRSGVGFDTMRATLGVVSGVFLAACFVFAVQINGGFDEQSFRVKVAAAAGVFAVGMAVAGFVVPSAVALGLAVLGVEATVILSLLAAGGVSIAGLTVAALVAALVLLFLALRLPATRLHPRGPAWMAGVAALLAVLPASEQIGVVNGLAITSSGVLALALVLIAWRRRLLVPAIVAVPALLTVEGYVVARSVTSGTDAAVGVLVIGIVLLLVVGVVGAAMRNRARTRTGLSSPPTLRGVWFEELLLAAAAVFALLSLAVGPSTPFPFGIPAGSIGSGSEPAPTLAPFPSG